MMRFLNILQSMRRKILILLFGAFLIFSGCSRDGVPVAESIGVTTNHTIEVDDVSRSYTLHRPHGLSANAPLVFVLHGYGGSPSDISNYTKMSVKASEYGFAVCYPEGMIGPDGFRSWNVGYSNINVDDIKFLNELALHLHENYGLSSENTFCTGMSNGADMTLQMAYLKPDLFKAIAPVAGTLMNWIPAANSLEKITSTLMINGTKDGITLWEGDENYQAVGIDGYMGTRETIDLFVGMNECMETLRTNFPNINQEDGSTVVFEKNFSCSDQRQIWLFEVVNGGHDWPGSWGNKDINASEEIWEFFEQFIN
jgi:polyhydroxybutyrate depolymerase